MDKPQIILHAEQGLNYTVFDTKWIPYSAKIIVLGSHPNSKGAFEIYDLDQANLALLKQETKSKAIKCGTFGASTIHQRELATGNFEGKMQIWDLEKSEFPIYSVDAHKEIINCIDGVGGLGIGKGAPEIVTGSRDGSVKVWDPRQKKRPVACMEPAQEDSRRDTWSVAFGHAYHTNERVVCAGYDNGDIKMFDLRTLSVKWESNLKNGVCCVEFDRKDIQMNKLVATSLESKFKVYDLRTLHPKKGFAHLTERAHNSTIWLARHLPQNRDVFMTTGGNGKLCLWKYCYPSERSLQDAEGVSKGVPGKVEQLSNQTIGQQPITGFDWNRDKTGLLVCSGLDQTVKVVIVTRLSSL